MSAFGRSLREEVESRMGVKIWAQSASDLTVHSNFAKSIAPRAAQVLGDDVEVDVFGVEPGTYPPGTVAEQVCCQWPVTHALMAVQIMENAIKAERQGYDAMVVTSFMDHGVDLARSAVDLPVVGLAESSLVLGSLMGRRMGLLCPFEVQARIVRELVDKLGFTSRVGMVRTIEPEIPTKEIDEQFHGQNTLYERLEQNVAPLAAAGVDVVIPAEGFLNSAVVTAGIEEVDGIPVLDALGGAFALAAALVGLRQVGSYRVSRAGRWAKAPADAIDHVRGITTQVLSAAAQR